MHQVFMLIVILALLPAAIATAVALGQILFYLLVAATAIFAVVYLLIHPDVLVDLLGLAAILIGFMAATYGVMWLAARVEKQWPCILQRLGYGSGAFFCALLAVLLPLDALKRGTPAGEMLALFVIFGLIAAALGWWTTKAKPTDTSHWFKR
jgi:hypothetical protein